MRFFFLLFFSPSPCLVYLLRPAVACRCSVSPVVAMTAPLSSTSIAATPTDDRTLVRAVLALGVGGFSIGTGEFVIMGLLPEVARDIGVSIPQAGHVISAYALGVVVGAPVLAVLCAHWWPPHWRHRGAAHAQCAGSCWDSPPPRWWVCPLPPRWASTLAGALRLCLWG